MLQVSCTNRTMGNRQVATTIPFWGKKRIKTKNIQHTLLIQSHTRFTTESACGRVDSFSRAASKGYPDWMVGTRATYCLTFPRLDIKVSVGLVPSEGCSCLSPHFRWFSHNLWQSPALSHNTHIPACIFPQCSPSVFPVFPLYTSVSVSKSLLFRRTPVILDYSLP